MGFSNVYLHLLFISIITALMVSARNETNTTLHSKNQIVNVGLILDFSSSAGYMANSCISMALTDFYSKNQHYATRLALIYKNSSDILTAASAALELVNEDRVVAIIGPQHSNEARFVAEIGEKSQVPIISFSMTSSSHWPSQTPYFIHTTLPDSSQLEGITSLVQQLGWNQIVLIYQNDTQEESGNGFIPSLIDNLQKENIQLSYVIAISSSASVSDHIIKELHHLRRLQTWVFLVHVTSPELASRLFYLANEAGMMSKGTAWIITDALSTSLSSLNATTIESMEGVLGVRPYVPNSKDMEDFKIRWSNLLLMQQQPIIKSDFMFYLWVYDTVWALATAVEKIQFPEEKRSYEKLNASKAAFTNLRSSKEGPRLVGKILENRFLGLSEKFKLNHEDLETPVLEIINITGNRESSDTTVGYWTARRGFSRNIVNAAGKDQEIVSSKPVDLVFKPILWPGDSTTKPEGWDLKLRVGVPKNITFNEFVHVQEIGDTKKYNVTGFSIDVFQAALTFLPFRLELEFIPFETTYDYLFSKLSGTENPDLEAIVGDITIRASREKAVDFSLSYTETGVGMVVRNGPDKQNDMWIFLKPLSWDLWLMIFLATICIGLVLRMLERRSNPQRQLGLIVLCPLAALAFPERNMVGNNWARFVLVVWLFMAYILMQSYTANLSSILTVHQLRPSADIACAGYQKGSSVLDMLTKLLSMDRATIRSYSSMKEYDEALSRGCANGGVDAIFDEIPYIKLFLSKYGSKYKMVGTTYHSGGFGFAFPTGSRLSKPISEAILDLMENGKLAQIERKYFEVGRASQDDAEDASQNRPSPSLSTNNFAGLFIITAFLTLIALVCSEYSFTISRYRVHSIEMAHDAPIESDLQDHREQNDDENLAEEESNKENTSRTMVMDDHVHIRRASRKDQAMRPRHELAKGVGFWVGLCGTKN